MDVGMTLLCYSWNCLHSGSLCMYCNMHDYNSILSQLCYRDHISFWDWNWFSVFLPKCFSTCIPLQVLFDINMLLCYGCIICWQNSLPAQMTLKWSNSPSEHQHYLGTTSVATFPFQPLLCEEKEAGSPSFLTSGPYFVFRPTGPFPSLSQTSLFLLLCWAYNDDYFSMCEID